VEPAGKGTIMRTGLLGQTWAIAEVCTPLRPSMAMNVAASTLNLRRVQDGFCVLKGPIFVSMCFSECSFFLPHVRNRADFARPHKYSKVQFE
jgi:hypothetical protein